MHFQHLWLHDKHVLTGCTKLNKLRMYSLKNGHGQCTDWNIADSSPCNSKMYHLELLCKTFGMNEHDECRSLVKHDWMWSNMNDWWTWCKSLTVCKLSIMIQVDADLVCVYENILVKKVWCFVYNLLMNIVRKKLRTVSWTFSASEYQIHCT